MRDEIQLYLREMLDWLKSSGYPRSWELGGPTRTDGHTVYTLPNVPQLDARLFISLEIPPVLQFQCSLNADAAYKALICRVKGGLGRTLLVPSTIARALIQDYLDNSTQLVFEERLANEIANNFINSIGRGWFGIKTWAPLAGFSCDQDRVDCGNGWCIVRYDETEAFRLLHKGGLDDGSLKTWPFALVREQQISFEDESLVIDPWRGVDYILKALRLLSPGLITIPLQRMIPEMPGSIFWHGSYSKPLMRPPVHDITFHLDSEDVSSLKRLTHVIEKSEFQKEVRIALDRVNLAAERSSIEDMFIDHVVALEAIYGDNADGLPAGLSYKIALRLAMFLHPTPQERESAFRSVKYALGVRGKVVHGQGTVEALKESDKASIRWVGEMARLTVRKILLEQIRLRPGYVDNLIFHMK